MPSGLFEPINTRCRLFCENVCEVAVAIETAVAVLRKLRREWFAMARLSPMAPASCQYWMQIKSSRDLTLTAGSTRLSHFISFIRIPALAVRQHIRPLPRLGILDEDRLDMRVWPNNIDFNLHMNNARYLSLMDYGRMHLLARTQVLTHVIRSRW